jgi:hypothetical protein
MKDNQSNKSVIPVATRNLFLFLLFFTTSFLSAQTTNSIASYHSIHYKGIATINIDEQIFSGQFNYVNVIDSFFYIQLNVAGLEAGRILVTPDSVLFINKFQKNYYQGDYRFFRNYIDVDIDFYTLQAIFNNLDTTIPDEVNLLYEGEFAVDDKTFFSTLTCEHEMLPLELKMEIKKVTFNDVPKVSATVPKNFSEIKYGEYFK